MFAPDVLCFSVIQCFFLVVFYTLHNIFSVLLRILLSAWQGRRKLVQDIVKL